LHLGTAINSEQIWENPKCIWFIIDVRSQGEEGFVQCGYFEDKGESGSSNAELFSQNNFRGRIIKENLSRAEVEHEKNFSS